MRINPIVLFGTDRTTPRSSRVYTCWKAGRWVPAVTVDIGGQPQRSREREWQPADEEEQSKFHLAAMNGMLEDASWEDISEIMWIKSVGGLYSFSFHSQYMAEQENRDVIQTIINTTKEHNSYLNTVGGISNWWKVKNQIENDLPVSEANKKLYGPVRITVDVNGKLKRNKL